MKEPETYLLKDSITLSKPTEEILNARERSRLETRRRLMEAGAALFAKDGYERTSVAAIAEKAQVASGTLFFHFKNKEGLFQEIALYYLYELHAQLRESNRKPAQNIEHSVRMHTETIVRFVDENRGFFSVLVNRMNSGSVIGETLAQLLVKEQIDRLNEGISEGFFRDDVDVEIAAQCIIGMLFRALSWFVNHPSNSNIEKLIDTITKIRYSGIHNGKLPTSLSD